MFIYRSRFSFSRGTRPPKTITAPETNTCGAQFFWPVLGDSGLYVPLSKHSIRGKSDDIYTNVLTSDKKEITSRMVFFKTKINIVAYVLEAASDTVTGAIG